MIRFLLLWALCFAAGFLVSCTATQTETPKAPPVVITDKCKMKPTTVNLQQGSMSLPSKGKFVTESHYATTEEKFKRGTELFPSKGDEQILLHLQASCTALTAKALSCPKYNQSWEKVWTPSENGKVGQGSRGDNKPGIWEEMFQGNMLYKVQPKIGTRYLITNKKTGKSIVAAFGREIGPGDHTRWVGGLTVEAMFFLEANNNTELHFGELEDQSLEFGPIECPAPQALHTLPVKPPVTI